MTATGTGTTTVSAATRRRIGLAAGDLARACLHEMRRRHPWFAELPADQRAGVALVTQTGVANFVAWLGERGEPIRLTAEAFRIAPHDLAERLSLRQTVDLVRIATEVFERQLPPLATDEAERRVLVDAILRFGREIAFAAATVYAGAAENRGAWDARQEAQVVDAVVRGEADDALISRASALGWNPTARLRVVAGNSPQDAARAPALLRREADRAGRAVLVGSQGGRLVVLVADPGGLDAAALTSSLVEAFGPGPVVVGPPADGLANAHVAAREALAGLRAAPGWPDAPRPVDADALLPERALLGDPTAHERLRATITRPLAEAGGELARTLEVYLEGGGSLESCARELYVHPNTVRYRLRRVAEITGHSPTDPRSALVLRAAVILGRLGP
ncbi:DNA-binding transcriptional regulator, PucR family [Pseudonocardia thermophila]|uniref:DNA-binding transcriptional regulator, PucR family n=1 Tax=Pseudonocardia thermophila TaxID=1848 RepID=A0A1M6QUS8_PSETH|nr:helix-turn-helix domain-containing protein [Pseudonocardia thermophila]SHK23787.1 DNA-binding transcriptional regulator, PucR family [Pseudonocardia thermophila]